MVPAPLGGFSVEKASRKESRPGVALSMPWATTPPRALLSNFIVLLYHKQWDWFRPRVSIVDGGPGWPQCAHLESKSGSLWPLPTQGSQETQCEHRGKRLEPSQTRRMLRHTWFECKMLLHLGEVPHSLLRPHPLSCLILPPRQGHTAPPQLSPGPPHCSLSRCRPQHL